MQQSQGRSISTYLFVAFFFLVIVLTLIVFVAKAHPPTVPVPADLVGTPQARVATPEEIASGLDTVQVVPSDHGAGIDGIINYQMITTGTLFVLGHVLLILFLLGSTTIVPRKWRRPSLKTEWKWSVAPAILMALISEVGVLILGMPVWAKVYDPPEEAPFVVDVMAMQFNWVVRYPGPDGVFGATDSSFIKDGNEMGIDPRDPAGKDDLAGAELGYGNIKVPLGRDIVVRLRSLDVLHSFAIPEFRVKQDVVPGYQGKTRFKPTVAGRFRLICMELCGLSHYNMNGYVEVLPPEEFAQWCRTSGAFNPDNLASDPQEQPR